MAVVHRTTLTPGKLDLLTAWLPGRTWYRGGTPRVRRAGGFRLDDPAGEVGIEFVLLADDAAEIPVVYQVPMTYRGAPLPGAEHALIGTAEHGVLGRRWIYDGPADPVLAEVTLDLLAGDATAQHQHDSGAADPTVRVSVGPRPRARPGAAVDGEAHTDLRAGATVLRFHRRLPAAGVSARVLAEVAVPVRVGAASIEPAVVIGLISES